MFCSNCGKQLEDGSGFCPFCGSAQNTQQQNPYQQNAQQQNTQQQSAQQANWQQYYQQPGEQPNQQYQQVNQQYQQPQSGGNNDSGSFWWAVPGFFIPLVGLFIFFLMRNNKPASAKMALIGAGMGVAFYFVLANF